MILTHSLKDICVHVPTSNFKLHPPFGGSDVKNQPAMPETWFISVHWEDALEEGMTTHSSILAWKVPMDRGAWRTTVHGVTELDTTEHACMPIKAI